MSEFVLSLSFVLLPAAPKREFVGLNAEPNAGPKTEFPLFKESPPLPKYEE